MSLILLIVVLIVLFGGGGWFYNGGAYRGTGLGIGGILLLVLLVLWLTGSRL